METLRYAAIYTYTIFQSSISVRGEGRGLSNSRVSAYASGRGRQDGTNCDFDNECKKEGKHQLKRLS